MEAPPGGQNNASEQSIPSRRERRAWIGPKPLLPGRRARHFEQACRAGRKRLDRDFDLPSQGRFESAEGPG